MYRLYILCEFQQDFEALYSKWDLTDEEKETAYQGMQIGSHQKNTYWCFCHGEKNG